MTKDSDKKSNKLLNLTKSLMQKLNSSLKSIQNIQNNKATEILEKEVEELQYIFTLLSLGNLIGYPGAPLFLTYDLLPYMTEELEIMLDKVTQTHDPLAQLFSTFDIG